MNMDQKSYDIQTSNSFEELKNLLLNTNITITPTTTQPKGQTHSEEGSSVERNNSENKPTAAKRRKYFDDSASGSGLGSNPLSSLPVSLISNGILSVTSDSSCVAIENGVPILKKTPEENSNHVPIPKQTGLSIHPIDAVLENNSKNNKLLDQPTEQPQTKNENSNIPHSYKASKSKSAAVNRNKSESAIETGSMQENSHLSFVTKALSNVCRVPPFREIGIIPHGNQFDFLPLLGLEIVVDSCCSDKRQKYEKPSTLLCGQCQTDFTKSWHFLKDPLIVLCENCFIYNEYQNIKAKQTLRLVEEYTKIYNLKHTTGEYTSQMNSENILANRTKQELVQNFINAANISSEGGGGVSELTRVGASIAANPEIFQAAKAINLLDENIAPEVRAKYVQLFQIELFKELRQCLSSFGGVENSFQEQSLQFLQMTIAQMKRHSNESTLHSTDTANMEPLNGILRAVETQYQNLLTTIMKQIPQQMQSTNETKQ